MRSILARIVVVMSVLIVAAGCGSHDDQDAPLGSALFDPCEDIRDSTFAKAGFDPATKVHPAPEFPERCSVTRAGGSTGLILEHYSNPGAASVFDQELNRPQTDPDIHVQRTSINGRDAFTKPVEMELWGKKARLGCDVDLRTKLGMLRINQTAHDDGSDSCNEAVAAATILEPAIGPNR